jgi:hypothetical protein
LFSSRKHIFLSLEFNSWLHQNSPILINKQTIYLIKASVSLHFQFIEIIFNINFLLVFNLFKLDVKTHTANGVNFNVVGEHNTETARTFGTLETKYVVPEYGLTFLEKWNTDNLLKLEITADDQLAQGFKVVFDASLIPNTG